MGKYLTTNQFKLYNMGLNTFLSSFNDLQLGLLIDMAEAQIDAHMGFDKKTGGFEPGIRTAQSPFDSETRRTPPPNPFIPMRRVVDYKIQISNLTTSGSGFFANINPGDVALNLFQGYLEIVPLQAITYSVFPGALDFGLTPPIVVDNIEQGFYLASLTESLMDDGSHKTYYAKNGFWATSYNQALATQPSTLPPIPYQLYLNGALVSNGVTVDTTEGSVVFNTQNQATDKVTLSYCYQIPEEVRKATVLQTTYLLQRARLNQLGLFPGVQRIRTGDQEIAGPTRPMQEVQDGLFQDVAEMLDHAFGRIGVG